MCTHADRGFTRVWLALVMWNPLSKDLGKALNEFINQGWFSHIN
jgi:hypothetical protein